MTAQTGPRDARKRIGDVQNDPVKDGEIIYKGAGVCLDATGHAVNATAVAGLVTRGVARDTVDNTDGGKRLDIEEGVYQFVNPPPGPDHISQADVLHLCYWIDNQTVGKVATARSIAGVIKSVENDNRVSVSLVPLSVPATPPVALAGRDSDDTDDRPLLPGATTGNPPGAGVDRPDRPNAPNSGPLPGDPARRSATSSDHSKTP